ncbi:MAG: ABC transporter ATP-binding protein [Syntrophales bacterium]
MSDIVIKAESIGKKYVIGHQAERGGYTALRDVLMQNARTLWKKTKDMAKGKPIIQGDTMEEVWALKDVSFDILRGEAVGIIGRNGAGKSTLLKILSRITEPSTGRVTIKGRVASLLEVGTGFHPELSGRENIYLNGAILGMSRDEIRLKFNKIVSFAEVEKYLDTPVKRYSSGMYVRLAFAVAAHLDPEILLVDEVLAVGDATFQKKCLGKMGDVAKEGRTVLFVSHNMTAIKSLCSRAILLDKGQIGNVGETGRVVSAYLQEGTLSLMQQVWDDPATAIGNDKVRLHRVYVTPLNQQPTEPITVETSLQLAFEFWNNLPDAVLNFSVVLYSFEGVCILNTASQAKTCSIGLVCGSFVIPGNFLNDDTYTVRLLIVKDTSVPIIDVHNVLTFEVQDIERGSNWYGKWIGAVRPQFDWVLRTGHMLP